ncbi:RNA dependent RNA polymerase-domain-containing protein [Schizophyllum fasciatum]
MDIFMRNIGFSTTQYELTQSLADILHHEPYNHMSGLPINFAVRLFKDKNGVRQHRGMGILTVPTEEIGRTFLFEYGEALGRAPFKLCYPPRSNGRAVKFKLGDRPPIASILGDIRRLPYQDPRAVQAQNERTNYLQRNQIGVTAVQFGWECYDAVFSIEWEESFQWNDAYVMLDDERREIRVRMRHPSSPGRLLAIAIRFSQIRSISAPRRSESPAITITLSVPPFFESEVPNPTPDDRRVRLQCLPFGNHEDVVPYTSLALRLVLPSQGFMQQFHDIAEVADVHHLDDCDYPAVRRGIFGPATMERLRTWQRQFPWMVGFQIEGLLRCLLLQPDELLAFMPKIHDMYRRRGAHYCALFLKFFQGRLVAWVDYEDDSETIQECFDRAGVEFAKQGLDEVVKPTDGSVFDSLHVIVTPTTMILEGPFPERSNRIIRMFDAKHHDSFLRVSFVEEGRLQYRFDREVDGRTFICDRIGPLLKEGLVIAGHKFDFLAYSQSALKEHAVWFVKPFRVDGQRTDVTAATIIKGIGNFENSSDRYCPARYAARLSQAFTATDASVFVEAEEIGYIEDISTPDGAYHFTDGVGTMSREMAVDTWTELRRTRKRARKSKGTPASFQVRFMGSKGMLSVDYKLRGRAVCLRESMIKFEAPNSMNLEIARAFDRPGKYYLNRPLIMLLEGLGVPYETFLKYQDMAVADAHRATESLEHAARMLESFGLGTSFRLSSVMLNLEKLGIDSFPGDTFYDRMLEFAINHVLRVLKNHARIPVPGAHTLVGVADVHRYLREGEIFACVKPHDSNKVEYLEGDILISRSPTIHPGDVQVVRAIGLPPAGSPFSHEPLHNTVVFSVRGHRPLPSMLGGGDLDGDVYNLISLDKHPEFRPKSTHGPASYEAAPRKTLDRPANMDDVADFVLDFIQFDVLGIIAINWLIIADQSQQTIFDQDCLTLSQLHSDAVDFPKSGQPVEITKIPRLKFKAKPDWNAPETVNADSARYYESQRAIGRLFRAIELPAVRTVQQTSRAQGRRRRRRRAAQDDLADDLAGLAVDEFDDPLFEALYDRVSAYDVRVDDEPSHEERESTGQLFQRYTNELRSICATNTLSQSRAAMLTEEEATMGTIVQKTSQPRKRKDQMAKLREQTDFLVRGIREEMAGDDDDIPEVPLHRAWLAWQLAWRKRKQKLFGAQSFGWVAMGAIFEAVKEIEEKLKEEQAYRFY